MAHASERPSKVESEMKNETVYYLRETNSITLWELFRNTTRWVKAEDVPPGYWMLLVCFGSIIIEQLNWVHFSNSLCEVANIRPLEKQVAWNLYTLVNYKPNEVKMNLALILCCDYLLCIVSSARLGPCFVHLWMSLSNWTCGPVKGWIRGKACFTAMWHHAVQIRHISECCPFLYSHI